MGPQASAVIKQRILPSVRARKFSSWRSPENLKYKKKKLRAPMAKVVRPQGHSLKFYMYLWPISCDDSSCNPHVSNTRHMSKTLVFINWSCFLLYLEEKFRRTLNDRAKLLSNLKSRRGRHLIGETFSWIATVNVCSVKKVVERRQNCCVQLPEKWIQDSWYPKPSII